MTLRRSITENMFVGCCRDDNKLSGGGCKASITNRNRCVARVSAKCHRRYTK